MKTLFTILFTLTCLSSAYAFNPSVAATGVPFSSGCTCSTTPDIINITSSTGTAALTSTVYGYLGGIWTGVDFDICRVDVAVRDWINTADIDNMAFEISVYSADGTSLGTALGASDEVDGDQIPSAYDTYAQFDFSTAVSVTSGDIIVFNETTLTIDADSVVKIGINSASDTDLDRTIYQTDGTLFGAAADGTTPQFKIYSCD